jgi:hypothetical protein
VPHGCSRRVIELDLQAGLADTEWDNERMSTARKPPRANARVAGAARPAGPRSPDFVGIGAQKAGTTWLDVNLRGHPDIWLPPVKELHYFDEVHIPSHRKWTPQQRRRTGTRALKNHLSKRPEEEWNFRFIARTADIVDGNLSDEWYRNIFGLARLDQVCGELTPEYSILPDEGIAHVLRLAPDAKIILSCRDPIERNWSHVRMMASTRGVEDPAELERIASYHGVTDRTDYPTIIARWLRHVAPSQLLVIFMDDIIRQPAETMAKVCAHIGVKFSEAYFRKLETPVHAGEQMEMPQQLYIAMKQHLRPIYDRMAERYPDIARTWIEKHY